MARGFVLLAFAALVGLAWLGVGQTWQEQRPAGGVFGAVLDPSHASIPNASVTVTSDNSRWSTTVLTNTFGLYWVHNLAPGSYSLHVEAKGFEVTNVTGITIEAGAVARGTVTLRVADGGGKQ
jgi:Carboxypeptidase regulatory-like domain